MSALLAMTRAKAGSAVVADAEGMLLGIFTDGDFRRLVSERGSAAVLADKVSEHMTKSPLFVHNDAYVSELLKIFQKKHIDDLPVVDASGRVAGLVDIQDLPKMKVL